METEMDISMVNNVSEIEIVYKSRVKASLRPKIKDSKDAALIFKKYWNQNKIGLLEECFTMYLNRANKVLAIMQVSAGGICGTVVDPRIIFSSALKLTACALIFAHNHPSQALQPSQADIELTKTMKEGGKLLQIKVLDHLILGEEDAYYSMADSGII
jgi:DNA repair protein RadC